jgi:hypothetical protein
MCVDVVGVRVMLLQSVPAASTHICAQQWLHRCVAAN